MAWVLITGGSSGLGAACVRRFVESGTGVVIADLTSPPDPISNQAVFAKTDVTSEADVRAAIEQGERQFGALRGAVLCAGILHSERVFGRDGLASLDTFCRVIDINLTGTFNTMRLAAEAILRNELDADGERGVIVMTSSVAAFDGQIGQASYSASKGAVASMTLPLAREFAQHGIRVVSIAPGVFETPMMAVAPEKVRLSLITQTMFPKRLGHPDEFAALVMHIFDNHMLNGCTIRLDGAMRMPAK